MIYKPSNCHPFASAIDITKTFLRLEKKDNGTWGWRTPEAIYLTGKIETDNNLVIGYKVRLYADGKLVFEGDRYSPFSELPKFDEDKTVNTGRNGTYFAIPFIQPGQWWNGKDDVSNYHITESYNALYVTGYYDKDPSNANSNTTGIQADYVIASSFNIGGQQISPDPDSQLSKWERETVGSEIHYLPRFDTDVITLNGGYIVSKEDIVFVNGYDDKQYLCRLSEDGKYLIAEKDVSVSQTRPLYILKGIYAGLYDGEVGAELTDDLSERADEIFSGYTTIGSLPVGFLTDHALTWEIDLIQGPENYLPLLTSDQIPVYFKDGVSNVPKGFYDMKVVSGTILGSCAKRMHLSDALEKEYLPGYGLGSALVLSGKYGELFSTEYTKDRLTPSFPVDNFDASFGHIYPKNGYITQDAFEQFEQTIHPDSLGIRFYKYSSNMEDTLSNEKVKVAYINIADQNLDPREKLVQGYICDRVLLNSGDRVLWCNSFAPSLNKNGAMNGLWIVSENAQTPPERPADGNDYADYIGKAILVSGGTKAGKVYLSDAVAGSNVALGETPIYFFEQRPEKIFDWESIADSMEKMEPPTVDYLFTADDLIGNSLFFYNDSGNCYTRRFPVMSKTNGEISVIVHFYTLEAKGSQRYYLYYLYLNKNGYVQFRMTEADGYTSIRFHQDGDAIYIKGFLINKEYDGKCFLENKYNHWYKLQNGIDDTSGSSKFVDLSATALVLLNTTTTTYISPTGMIASGMDLKLKNGATYIVSGGNDAQQVLEIDSYDKTFNAITHTGLSEPFEAKENNLIPSTPYKYDIISCFRTSDQNAFAFANPLTPHIEPTDLSGELVGGYSAFADASCFQGSGKAWNSARLVLQHGDDPEKWQDTDWFHDGNLDTEFLGLEPNMGYSAVIYAKDGEGRITQGGRSITVPEDSAEYLHGYGFGIEFYIKEKNFEITLAVDADFYGFTTDNNKEYGKTTGSTFSGSGQSVSVSDRDVSLGQGKLTLSNKFTLSDFASGPIHVSTWIDSPRGRLVFYGEWLITVNGSDYDIAFIRSHVSSPFAPPAFTGTFSGTLTAEPDCSTQSVLLNYEPATGVGDWPNGLPPEQNGTYDIYKREYADLRKEYPCGSDANGERLWFGDWEPVALAVGRTNIRDFNVRQGHSYQYAIVPRKGPSLKIERRYCDRESEDSCTSINESRAVIAFDNSFIGLPRGSHIGDGLGASITTSSEKVKTTDRTVSYYAPTVVGNLKNGYITLNYSKTELTWPVTVDLTFSYHGLNYSARVIFTSGTEFAVEPLGGSYAWRKRLFANDGDPVYIQWGDWSLAELDEVDTSSLFEDPTVRRPFVRKAYKVDPEKVWLFRYGVEPGSQSINLAKGEISTLGKYARFSSGSLNAESGDVSAWLGSEVVPGYRNGYIERRRSTVWAPAATNEATAMLAAFRAMVASDKPKLLRDRKGRSWIVQVSGGSSSTMDNIVGTPTKVSFSWKEIAPTGPYVAIWGDGDELPPIDAGGEWKPNIILTP